MTGLLDDCYKAKERKIQLQNTDGTQGRSPCDIKDRDWSDAVYKQRNTKDYQRSPETRRRQGRILP